MKKSESGQLVGFDLSIPDSWLEYPLVGRPDDWPTAVVADLDLLPATKQGITTQLEALDESLNADGEEHIAAAVWIPRPETGLLRSILVVDLIQPTPGEEFSRDRLRADLELHQDAALVHKRELTDVELPAGPALLQRDVLRMLDGDVEEYFVYTVFAPGAAEAVELRFGTAALEYGEVLEAEAAAIANTLVLSVSR